MSPKEELRRMIDELKAKKEAEKKAKNPNRVGGWYVELKRQREARGEHADNEWLPSFGGVWNEGPRSMHARKHRAYDPSFSSSTPTQAK
ncbi:uncharacterized protein ACA1_072920 [Acanthamoeba castellanii str. Neff]|uniref:Uncharacterized protein n=1 Tax=Acanthamoeba castellanii (strain ATCC 30010 / Neff) TaxID=1257118 RepID=L8HG14_ACACF|nr:uncharacterized protein ACA1_072920 [Acanthamoeba castellanii str. Neff]ELR23658.1 hypothetical protein ACA1_072920 [Acanthamoeba castellanii str. Neff]